MQNISDYKMANRACSISVAIETNANLSVITWNSQKQSAQVKYIAHWFMKSERFQRIVALNSGSREYMALLPAAVKTTTTSNNIR